VLALIAVLAVTLIAPATAAAHGAVTHRDTRADLPVTVAATAAAAAAPDALPFTWCGDERTVDDRPPSAPHFKLVYAHPADRPDRFAGWADALQANVALVQRFLAAQTGGAKALRFDMGTRCGPQYVDVQVVHLPRRRASYVDNFGAIVADVYARLGRGEQRNVVVLADTLNGGGYDYGLGETVLGPDGERRGPANPHNRGGFASVLFSRDGQPAPGASRAGWWPEGLLHEITHNLGAVQWSAPHSTQPPGFRFDRYGHCWQGADVMCYVEDPWAAHPMRYDCAPVGGAIPQAYDCGRDDYFNPAPPPGSYLARYWNVYDSAFLGSCAELAPACGGGMEGLAPSPPVSTGAPAVAGAPRRGQEVIAVAGGWQNGPLTYAYQWQRERDGAWEDVGSGSAYLPERDDIGRRLRVAVVATNPDGSAAAVSPPTAPVADAGVGSPSATTRACRRGDKARGRAGQSRRAGSSAPRRAGAVASRRGGSAKGRARRPAAKCRGRRTSTRASARSRSRSRRTSGAARATRPGPRNRSGG
jgi:hypothetical protein